MASTLFRGVLFAEKNILRPGDFFLLLSLDAQFFFKVERISPLQREHVHGCLLRRVCAIYFGKE